MTWVSHKYRSDSYHSAVYTFERSSVNAEWRGPHKNLWWVSQVTEWADGRDLSSMQSEYDQKDDVNRGSSFFVTPSSDARRSNKFHDLSPWMPQTSLNWIRYLVKWNEILRAVVAQSHRNLAQTHYGVLLEQAQSPEGSRHPFRCASQQQK